MKLAIAMALILLVAVVFAVIANQWTHGKNQATATATARQATAVASIRQENARNTQATAVVRQATAAVMQATTTAKARTLQPGEPHEAMSVPRDSDGRIPISEVCRLANPTIEEWIGYWESEGGTQAANDVAVRNIARKLREITGRTFNKMETAVIIAECVE